MHSFSTPWKHQKPYGFFRGVENWCIGNEWVEYTTSMLQLEKIMCDGVVNKDSRRKGGMRRRGGENEGKKVETEPLQFINLLK